ncbi:MAG: hypothetical protein DSY90_04720 [Deltaproteobacteria bacterium]|nr:MAG: hypothetical protein DSY90_04720 [Deltaproteobacteria bacterium]
MKTDQIYQHLIELAEKLDIDVSEQNFKISGFPVHSGICRVKGKDRIILDKHKSKNDKIDILIESLKAFPLDDLYVVPAIRDLLKRPE